MEHLIAKHRDTGLLLDANLLVLLFVGAFDRTYIDKHKRTREVFDQKAFDLLLELIDRFTRLITTPHLLTEASNLCGQMPDEMREPLFESMAMRINSDAMTEHTVDAKALVMLKAFAPFGLTDAAVTERAGSCLIATVDLALYHFLITQGYDAINFNHLRG